MERRIAFRHGGQAAKLEAVNRIGSFIRLGLFGCQLGGGKELGSGQSQASDGKQGSQTDHGVLQRKVPHCTPAAPGGWYKLLYYMPRVRFIQAQPYENAGMRLASELEWEI